MRLRSILGVALAGLGVAGAARAQEPAGGLKLSGTSTAGDWTCRETTIQAPASPGTAGGQPNGEKATSPAMTLRFPVQDIDCGSAVMNDHLREALKADQHPTISFALPPSQLERAAQAGSTPIAVDGTLTIAGQSQPVRTEVIVTPAPGEGYRVQGEQTLRMSQFGVKPPRLLLGMLKVRDLVHVAFDFVFRGHAAVLPGRVPLR